MGKRIRKLGHSIRKRIAPPRGLAAARERLKDVPERDFAIIEDVDAFTMVTAERLLAFIDAVRHVETNQIPGAIVECGVWKGGASVAAIRTLQTVGSESRQFYLYDTFEGMSRPTEHDTDHTGAEAILKFERHQSSASSSDWCRCSIEEVKKTVLSTGYDQTKINFVKGKVEDTIPGTIPDEIAVLRLDTDFYESTKHELEHLFPRVSKGGVLLIDDYGHWSGARKAVDDYFALNKIPMFLNRTDASGRAGVKTA